MILLSDGENHRNTGFLLDDGFTMSHGPIDGTVGPVAETGGHGAFQSPDAEQILAL